jgi:3'-phosphoadenosine 5'-phosphosulfate (PAPS) 3'-phosphatase
MIIKGLKLHFPSLKIIGEETEDFKGDIDFHYGGLKSDVFPSSTTIDKNLTIEDSCLWIDPIDCTRGFINGNFEDVTILIGLSHKNKP